MIGGASLLLFGVATLGVFALAWQHDVPRHPSRRDVERQRAAVPTADRHEAPLTKAPAAERSRPLEPEPEDESQPAEPEEWPPARAFTARCMAPGGGCIEQCTALAGGRCLDPCFIHTAGCSKDCMQQDGSCGWPPPDIE